MIPHIGADCIQCSCGAELYLSDIEGYPSIKGAYCTNCERVITTGSSDEGDCMTAAMLIRKEHSARQTLRAELTDTVRFIKPDPSAGHGACDSCIYRCAKYTLTQQGDCWMAHCSQVMEPLCDHKGRRRVNTNRTCRWWSDKPREARL